jgi:hypothetical protein
MSLDTPIAIAAPTIKLFKAGCIKEVRQNPHHEMNSQRPARKLIKDAVLIGDTRSSLILHLLCRFARSQQEAGYYLPLIGRAAEPVRCYRIGGMLEAL